MSQTLPKDHISDPRVFSRGSLQLTYDLIRPKNPALSLTVRNIINTQPLPKAPDVDSNKHNDYFMVPLDSFEVRAIVESLMEYNQGEVPQEFAGQAIMAKSILEDWLVLARQMIEELPADQRP